MTTGGIRYNCLSITDQWSGWSGRGTLAIAVARSNYSFLAHLKVDVNNRFTATGGGEISREVGKDGERTMILLWVRERERDAMDIPVISQITNSTIVVRG